MVSAYRFLFGLVYPAMLGANAAWFVQGWARWSSKLDEAPNGWVLLFGLWFILYEGIWYWFLLNPDARDKNDLPMGYTGLAVATDYCDIVSNVLGFVGLGLASGNYEHVRLDVAFLACGLLVASAAVANHPGWKWDWKHLSTYWLPFGAAITIPVVGGLRHYVRPTEVDDLTIGLLAGLYVVLWAYLNYPEIFNSHRTSGWK